MTLYSVALFAVCTALAGCNDVMRDADRAELDNILPWNIVPRSSPSQLVNTFDRFCVSGPQSASELEGALRKASYVPTGPLTPNKAQLFLVDDRRPAVTITERSCMVMARARTGQTQRVRDYVAAKFPEASGIDPSAFANRDIQHAWSTRKGVIATTLHREIDNSARYGLILMRSNT